LYLIKKNKLGTARAPGESTAAQGRDFSIFQPLDATALADTAMPVSEKPSKRSLPALNILPGDPENLGPSKFARSVRGEASTASLITPARMPLGKLGLSAGNSKNTPFPAAATAMVGKALVSGPSSNVPFSSAKAAVHLHESSGSSSNHGGQPPDGAGGYSGDWGENPGVFDCFPTTEEVDLQLDLSLRPELGASDFMRQVKKDEIRVAISRDFEINCYYMIIIFLLIESK